MALCLSAEIWEGTVGKGSLGRGWGVRGGRGDNNKSSIQLPVQLIKLPSRYILPAKRQGGIFFIVYGAVTKRYGSFFARKTATTHTHTNTQIRAELYALCNFYIGAH